MTAVNLADILVQADCVWTSVNNLGVVLTFPSLGSSPDPSAVAEAVRRLSFAYTWRAVNNFASMTDDEAVALVVASANGSVPPNSGVDRTQLLLGTWSLTGTLAPRDGQQDSSDQLKIETARRATKALQSGAFTVA